MDGTVTSQRNPVLGWDISVSAKAGAGEGIGGVEVAVNGFTQVREEFNPPANQWQRVLIQQGEYPGDNKAELIITDAKEEQTSYYSEWS